MFSKKGMLGLLLGALVTFFAIALSSYMIYISFKPKKVQIEPHTTYQIGQDRQEEENQIVMAQSAGKINAHTNVVFEIVDQLGLVTQTNMYPGINWIDATRTQMSEMYPDYVITKFEEDQVMLRRVIERQIEPSYVLTKHNGHIVIATMSNGQMMFYKDTGIGQHDFSHKLGKALEQGISITTEQKNMILEEAEELYMILQEYDE